MFILILMIIHVELDTTAQEEHQLRRLALQEPTTLLWEENIFQNVISSKLDITCLLRQPLKLLDLVTLGSTVLRAQLVLKKWRVQMELIIPRLEPNSKATAVLASRDTIASSTLIPIHIVARLLSQGFALKEVTALKDL